MTNAEKFNKIVIASVKELLKRKQFKSRKMTFFREKRHTMDAIQLQVSRFNSPDKFMFYMPLGVNWNEFKPFDKNRTFTTNSFTVHNRLEKLVMHVYPELSAGWSITNETDPIEFSTFLIRMIEEYGLPYLELGNDVDYVLNNFTNIGLIGGAGGTKEDFSKFVAKHKSEVNG